MLSAAWPGQGQECGGAKKWNTNLNRDVTWIEVYIYIFFEKRAYVWMQMLNAVYIHIHIYIYTYIYTYIYIYIYIAQVPKQKLEPLEARSDPRSIADGIGTVILLDLALCLLPHRRDCKMRHLFPQRACNTESKSQFCFRTAWLWKW